MYNLLRAASVRENHIRPQSLSNLLAVLGSLTFEMTLVANVF